MPNIAKHEVKIPSINEGRIYSEEVHQLVNYLMNEGIASYLEGKSCYFCNFFALKDNAQPNRDERYKPNQERKFYPIFESDGDRFVARLRFDSKRWIEDFGRNENINPLT